MTWFTMYYTVQNFENFEREKKEVNFANLHNAKWMGQNLSTCEDVVSDVDIIDGTTGEVMATYRQGKEVYFH